MNRVAQGPWLATVMFVLATAASWRLATGWSSALTFGIIAAFVTPLLWWGLVNRAPAPHPMRGAGAGALIGFVIHAIPLVAVIVAGVAFKAQHPHSDGAATAATALILISATVIATPIGACLGTLTALAQRMLRASQAP